jgi:hypothetical protein
VFPQSAFARKRSQDAAINSVAFFITFANSCLLLQHWVELVALLLGLL